MSSPLDRKPLISPSRTLVVAAKADRITPVAHARKLSAHFGSQLVDMKETPNLRIDMWSCNENTNVVKTAEGVTQFILPGEAGYKDPNTLTATPKE